MESAILFPVLAMMILGTARVGHSLGVQYALTQFSADTVRYALPGTTREMRLKIAQDYVSAHARTYTLLNPARMTVEIEELADSLSVALSMDVSDIPDVPLVAMAYTFPRVQTASATISVQR